MHAVNDTGKYFALPYGPSGTAPRGDVRKSEIYFERLEKAGLGKIKRPDMLIFRREDEEVVKCAVQQLNGIQELPFSPESEPNMQVLLSCAIVAVECENSLWRAKQMPDYGAELRPMRRLGGKLGLRKNAVLPTVILKEEDREPLRKWEEKAGVKIHIWHVFYDMSFGLSLDRAQELIDEGLTEASEQVFQAPGGPTTRKYIYKVYYHYAYRVGDACEDPELVADYVVDNNGHILPYVRFVGGKLQMDPEAMSILDRAVSSGRA